MYFSVGLCVRARTRLWVRARVCTCVRFANPGQAATVSGSHSVHWSGEALEVGASRIGLAWGVVFEGGGARDPPGCCEPWRLMGRGRAGLRFAQLLLGAYVRLSPNPG